MMNGRRNPDAVHVHLRSLLGIGLSRARYISRRHLICFTIPQYAEVVCVKENARKKTLINGNYRKNDFAVAAKSCTPHLPCRLKILMDATRVND